MTKVKLTGKMVEVSTDEKLYPIPELYKNDFKDIAEFNHFLSQVDEHYDGLPRQCDRCGGGMASFWMHDGGWAVCVCRETRSY